MKVLLRSRFICLSILFLLAIGAVFAVAGLLDDDAVFKTAFD